MKKFLGDKHNTLLETIMVETQNNNLVWKLAENPERGNWNDYTTMTDGNTLLCLRMCNKIGLGNPFSVLTYARPDRNPSPVLSRCMLFSSSTMEQGLINLHLLIVKQMEARSIDEQIDEISQGSDTL